MKDLYLFIETNVLWRDINKNNKLKMGSENLLYISTYHFHSQLIIAITHAMFSTYHFQLIIFTANIIPRVSLRKEISERQGNMGEKLIMLCLFRNALKPL